MANTLQVRRGAQASLPTLSQAEFGFSTDEKRVYIGDGAANIELAKAGANSNITSMTGLNNDGIPLAKVANAASDGANSDITSLSGLTTPLTKAQGGSGTTGDSIIKGWINFNGTGTIAINDSFNVTSITDIGTGDYTITWDTDFANVNYAISGVTQHNELATMPMIVLIKGSATAQLVGSCRIATQYTVDTNPYDCLQVQVMALGDQ